MYISVTQKLFIALAIALSVTSFVVSITYGWADSLSEFFHPVLAWAIVAGIAIIPSFAIALIYPLILLDKRPQYVIPEELPDVSILVAAYNEEQPIGETFSSISNQDYPGKIHVYLIDDGSTDRTYAEAKAWMGFNDYREDKFEFVLLRMDKNSGKSAALNMGLKHVTTDYVVTVDADTSLLNDAIAHLVTNIHLGPKNTAAVAGNILVRNSRETLMSRMQEWEYFLSISASKRSQSLLQGTLVAQGAISAFNTEAVREIGGWNETAVGEDIVLTWGLQLKGYRIAYAEKAAAFTNVPTTYRQFFKQRERWARGLIEAFKIYPGIIFRIKLTSPFIWANVLLPLVDAMFLFAFVPGLIAALFFGWYEIVSAMTLTVIPLIIILAGVMHIQHKRIFKDMGLTVRRNSLGLVFWAFTYMFWMCPATVSGYIKEIFKIGKKNWGTK